MKKEQKQMVDFEAFEIIREERDALQKELADADKRIEKQQALLDQQRCAYEKILAERDTARSEANYLRNRGQEAETLVHALKERLKDQEEMIERLKDQEETIERLKKQIGSFDEKLRGTQRRADSTANSLATAKDEVARLVRLNDAFRAQLAEATKEKYQVVEISNGFARERDEIRAEYDARGRVIKKLRKRLHKAKKKLKELKH